MSSPSLLTEVQTLVKSQIDQILEKHNKVENTNYGKVQKFEVNETTDFDKDMINIYIVTADCSTTRKEVMDTDNGNQSSLTVKSLTWFVKIPTADFTDDEAMENFSKECAFYNSLLTKFPMLPGKPWGPKCLMVSPEMIVLENVCNMGYSINCAGLLRLKPPELLSVLKSVAQLHAGSILAEHVKPSIYNNLSGFLKEKLFKTESIWFCVSLIVLSQLAKIHPKYSKRQKCIIQAEMYDHIIESCQMINPSKTYRNVVCYRPYPNTNIMLKTPCDDGNGMPVANAMLLDLYQCIYAPPAVDLLCIMAVYLDRDEQIAKEYDYIDYYYDELVENLAIMSTKQEGVIGLSKEELLESYEVYRLFGMICRAFHMTITHVPKEMRDVNYIYIERSPQLLQYMEKNKEFKLVMLQCAGDIFDNLLANCSLNDELSSDDTTSDS